RTSAPFAQLAPTASWSPAPTIGGTHALRHAILRQALPSCWRAREYACEERRGRAPALRRGRPGRLVRTGPHLVLCCPRAGPWAGGLAGAGARVHSLLVSSAAVLAGRRSAAPRPRRRSAAGVAAGAVRRGVRVALLAL